MNGCSVTWWWAGLAPASVSGIIGGWTTVNWNEWQINISWNKANKNINGQIIKLINESLPNLSFSFLTFHLFVGFTLCCFLYLVFWSVCWFCHLVCCVLCVAIWSVGRCVASPSWSVGWSTFSLESLPLDTPATKWPSSYTLIQSHTTLSLSIPLDVVHSLFSGTTALAQFGLLVKLFPQVYTHAIKLLRSDHIQSHKVFLHFHFLHSTFTFYIVLSLSL